MNTRGIAALFLIAALLILGCIILSRTEPIWNLLVADCTIVLSTFTLGVLIWQAFIYNSQRNIMAAQTGISSRQVDAQRGRPLLYPSIGPWPRGELVHAERMAPRDDAELTLTNITLPIEITNYGDAPAILVAVALKFIMSSDEPPKKPPVFGPADMPKIRVLKPGETAKPADRLLKHQFTRDDFQSLMSDKCFLWLYGAIECDDAWGTRYTSDVCWRYSLGIDVAEPHPAERNRTRRSEWQPPKHSREDMSSR